MKVIELDLKKGKARVKVETPNDVWHLYRIISKGCRVGGLTPRNIFICRNGQKIKVDRKLLWLKVDVESTSYDKSMNKLRVKGKIVEARDDELLGNYHTIEVSVGKEIEIEKEFTKEDLVRFEKAKVRQPRILVVGIDYTKAIVTLIDDRVERVAEIRNPHSLKDERQAEFYGQVVASVKELVKGCDGLVVAGPGFAKEEVAKKLKEYKPLIQFASYPDVAATELLKKGILQRFMKESRVSKETLMVEKFFEELAKGGRVCYGYEEVKNACKLGAIQTLLVSEDLIRRKEVEKLAKEVEEHGGKVEIIANDHEAGEKLVRMGGLAAFLRFSLDSYS